MLWILTLEPIFSLQTSYANFQTDLPTFEYTALICIKAEHGMLSTDKDDFAISIFINIHCSAFLYANIFQWTAYSSSARWNVLWRWKYSLFVRSKTVTTTHILLAQFETYSIIHKPVQLHTFGCKSSFPDTNVDTLTNNWAIGHSAPGLSGKSEWISKQKEVEYQREIKDEFGKGGNELVDEQWWLIQQECFLHSYLSKYPPFGNC